MANYCYFTMKVTGKKENVKELIEMMKWEGRFKENGLGRIYWVDEYDNYEEDGLFISKITGDCAWSVICSMMEDSGNKITLETESKRLNLVIEVFSEESGCCFQEHYLIVNGEVVINDSVDYESHFVLDYDSIQDYNEEFDTDFTEEMVDQDGYVVVGGYGDDYCAFQNHLSYFEEVKWANNQETVC